MFNLGPMELMVLAIVGLIVLGPDKLPGLARDAARIIRTLRELASGARTQLREELGPEFAHLADMDLRNLNPRTALTRAVLGDAELGGMNPSSMLRDVFRDDEPAPSAMPDVAPPPAEPTPTTPTSATPTSATPTSATQAQSAADAQQTQDSARYDTDAT